MIHRKTVKKQYLIFLLSLIFFATNAYAACDVEFEWTPNPESYVQGYKIHYGNNQGGPYDHVFDAGNPPAVDGKIKATIPQLPTGTWYFVATAYDSEYESEYSTEVSFVCQDETEDNTPPGDVSSVLFHRNGDSVTFTWTNPSDNDYAGVKIVYTDGSTDPALNDDGSVQTGTQFANVAAPGTSATASLQSGVPYKFAFFTYDQNGNYSHTVMITIPVVTVTYSPNPVNNPKTEVTFNVDINPECLGAITYEWNFGDGSGAQTVSTSSVKHTFDASQTYNVTLTLTNEDACQITQTIPITVNDLPPSKPTNPH